MPGPVPSKKRILYVEYDPRTAGKRHALMVAAGYTVGVVMSSRQAMQILGSDFFDLLVLSDTIPPVELEQIASATRARVPKLPLLLLTADSGGAALEAFQHQEPTPGLSVEEPLLQQIEHMLKVPEASKLSE